MTPLLNSLIDVPQSSVSNEAKALMNQWLGDLDTPASGLLSSTESLSLHPPAPPPPLPVSKRIVRSVPQAKFIQERKQDDLLINKSKKIRTIHERRKVLHQQQLQEIDLPSSLPIPPKIPKKKPLPQRSPQVKEPIEEPRKVVVPLISPEKRQQMSKCLNQVQEKHTLVLFFRWYLLSASFIFNRRVTTLSCFSKWKESFSQSRQSKERVSAQYHYENVLLKVFCQWKVALQDHLLQIQIQSDLQSLEVRRHGFISFLRANLSDKNDNKATDQSSPSQQKSQESSQETNSPPVVKAINDRHEERKKKRLELAKKYQARKIIEGEKKLMLKEDEFSKRVEVVRVKREQVRIEKERARLQAAESLRLKEIKLMNVELARANYLRNLKYLGFRVFVLTEFVCQ
ncbi:hypothetical protein GEMRC1_002044 [Eukaryota sp. GEM-RC1]